MPYNKRSIEDDKSEPKPKRYRPGFKIGPDNLPDGTYRRKVVKIKKDLIHKAKIKKSYAKLKAQEPVIPKHIPVEIQHHADPASQELHPERQAMLNEPQEATPSYSHTRSQLQPQSQQRRGKKPGYFDKEQAFAAKKQAEAGARRIEFECKMKEKILKVEERERIRKAMAKARKGGKNGQRKLGRESTVLLEKVKKMVST